LARTPLRETDPSRVGSYQLLARLGAGGMGVVYLASGQDGRPVALKVLRPEMADDAEFRTRFSREVTALTRVRGVCTVRVLDADTTAARPFLVTEYAEGPSLAEYVDSRGPVDPQMLYGLATGLAEALSAIHAAGIVHRDLKPSNVLLTAGGPKVIDFGIAQMLDATAVTRAGMTVGSAGYMAPEQIMGRAGTAADIFSWGVTIAYAASGQAPFGGGTSEAILYRILHGTPDTAAVPDSLRPQVTAALSKDPHDRPAAAELLSQLTRTAVVPAAGAGAGAGDPTQTILAQTWRPPTAPRETSAPPTPPAAAPSWTAPAQGTPSQPGSFWATPGPDTPSRSASPPAVPPRVTPPSGWPAPPDDDGTRAPRRPGLRRPVLVALVLGVAIVLGAGGAALAFALSSHPSTSQGNNPGAAGSHSATAPATAVVTNSSAATSSPAVATSASASTSPTQATSSATPSSSAALPVLVVGGYSGMKPTEIAYSGDSTNVVTGITWSSWTATSATGTGTSDIDNCVPSCAAASPNPVTATVTLSNPVDGHFTQMSETRNGTTTNYTYPSSWAQSAS
jgi:serine/threonine protein kinase